MYKLVASTFPSRRHNGIFRSTLSYHALSPSRETVSPSFFQIHMWFLFQSVARKCSSPILFSVILNKNLSSLWINNSWNFINNLQHCEVFAIGQPLTFFDHNKISSCAFIIFIMGKIHFSFIKELKSNANKENSYKIWSNTNNSNVHWVCGLCVLWGQFSIERLVH